MAQVELTGYHTTTRESAEKILASEFKANRKTDNDWLGVGIYFWDDIVNADWWKEVRFKNSTEACVLCAKLTCEEKEYIDFTQKENMEALLRFAEEMGKEMETSGSERPNFESVERSRHFYCTYFKWKYQIKIMRYTFEHTEYNAVGFPLYKIRPQLCVTDASVISDVSVKG